MNTDIHSTTRRNVLGGMALATALTAIGAPAIAAPLNSEWERALAAYERAVRDMNAFHRNHVEPANRHHEADATRENLQLVFNAEESWFPYTGAAHDAAVELVRTPAPNMDALKIKLHVCNEVGLFDSEWAADLIPSLIADTERMGAAAPITLQQPV